MTRCDWCDRLTGLPTRTEQGTLCEPCRDAYLREAAGESQAYIYGEQYRHTPPSELPVTPRADRYRTDFSWKREETLMPSTYQTPAESSARALKADAMLHVLGTRLTADELEHLDDAGWAALVQLAALQSGRAWTDASSETRALCVRILRNREATADRDPFDGFPRH